MDLQPRPLVLLVPFSSPRCHLAIRRAPSFSSPIQKRAARIRRRESVTVLLLVVDELWLNLSILLTLSAILGMMSIMGILVSDQQVHPVRDVVDGFLYLCTRHPWGRYHWEHRRRG